MADSTAAFWLLWMSIRDRGCFYVVMYTLLKHSNILLHNDIAFDISGRASYWWSLNISTDLCTDNLLLFYTRKISNLRHKAQYTQSWRQLSSASWQPLASSACFSTVKILLELNILGALLWSLFVCMLHFVHPWQIRYNSVPPNNRQGTKGSCLDSWTRLGVGT